MDPYKIPFIPPHTSVADPTGFYPDPTLENNRILPNCDLIKLTFYYFASNIKVNIIDVCMLYYNYNQILKPGSDHIM